MRRRTFVIAGAAILFLCISGYVLTRRVDIYEYGFESAGFVRDVAGRPIPGARVTLTFPNTVGYRAVEAIPSETVETNARGQFAFFFLVHEKRVKYRLLAEHPGFRKTTVVAEWPRDYGAVQIVIHR